MKNKLKVSALIKGIAAIYGFFGAIMLIICIIIVTKDYSFN